MITPPDVWRTPKAEAPAQGTPSARRGVARHPRGVGAFSCVLAKYVRGEHVLTLEDSLREMTSLAADHAG